MFETGLVALLANVPVFDTGGRGATLSVQQTFLPPYFCADLAPADHEGRIGPGGRVPAG